MKSLIRKSLRQFMICAAVVFMLATPLFYLLTKHFYAEELLDVIESVRNGMPIPTLDLEKDIMAGVVIQFLLIFVVLSIALILTLRFITKRLWHPFNDTLKKMQQFNVAQKSIPEFEDTDIREFAQLNSVATLLMRNGIDTYAAQKEFTENASHELQTPIAIFQSKLDLLLQENMNENQLKIVQELYTVSNRMSHLNKNLLLLAKIENNQYEKKENINLPAIIQQNIAIYKDLYKNRHIVFRVEDRGEHIISANRALLEILLSNLVINAIRHSKESEEILVIVAGKTLSVVNKAQGKPLDRDKLFRRFNNTAEASRDNGLGLAIVKAVCDYHDWKIVYNFCDGKHCFDVDFGRRLLK